MRVLHVVIVSLAVCACAGGRAPAADQTSLVDAGPVDGGARAPDAVVVDSRGDIGADLDVPSRSVDVGPVCIPNCTGKTCGDNGCGGVCGGCPEAPCIESHCDEGICVLAMLESEGCFIDGKCWEALRLNPENQCQACVGQTPFMWWKSPFDGCEDGDPCTLNDSCKNEVCTSGVAKDCDDGNPCTHDLCESVSGDCLHDPVDGPEAACDDGDSCTADLCDSGACMNPISPEAALGEVPGCECWLEQDCGTLTLVAYDDWTPSGPLVSLDVDCLEFPKPWRTIEVVFEGYKLGAVLTGMSSSTLEFNIPWGLIHQGVQRICFSIADDGVPLCCPEATVCLPVSYDVLCDFLADPICDDGNPCTASACLWDSNLDHRKCVFGPMDIDDHPFCCPSTGDCVGPSGPVPCIQGQCAWSCLQDADCDDGIPETADPCVQDPGAPCSDEGYCIHVQ
ncbi:MAG: hypothetical protein ABIK09_20040 [Pseudomonadota bacterium]